jgi:phage tail-like protein
MAETDRPRIPTPGHPQAPTQGRPQEPTQGQPQGQSPVDAGSASQGGASGQAQNLARNREALSSVLAKSQQTRRARAQASAHREHRANYVLTHRFYVEMDGVIRAAFNECSGFGLDVKKEVYLEGGVNDQQRIMLGHAEFQDTVLKRGMTSDSTFWLWMQEVLVGRTSDTSGSNSGSQTVRTRRNVNILMMNQAGSIMQACTLVGAIPISWKAPAFQADSAAVAIEEMTLAYEGIHLQFQTETNQLAAGGATSSLQRDDLGFFPDH